MKIQNLETDDWTMNFHYDKYTNRFVFKLASNKLDTCFILNWTENQMLALLRQIGGAKFEQ